MLSSDAAEACYILSLGLFIISGTQMLTGISAAICGIVGCALLSSGFLHYCPLGWLINIIRDGSPGGKAKS